MSPDHSANIDDSELASAIVQLQQGQCVAIPTETVYGLAADATNGLAVARIFEMKERPKFNPLICHVSSLDMAERYGNFDAVSTKLAKDFWPGPLTIVVPFKADAEIHPLVTAGLGTIGLRCPDGPSLNLIERFGKPLAAPSANRSGKISPTTAQHVRDEFQGTGLLVLDAGSCDIGLESTIVKVEDGVPILLRPGMVTKEMITESCGMAPGFPRGEKIEAPGMMKSHYAPNATVVMDCKTCPQKVAKLNFGESDTIDTASSLNLSPSGNLREAAANLYAYLSKLDETGLRTICVSPIPDEGLGIAINDRLRRAAAPRKNA